MSTTPTDTPTSLPTATATACPTRTRPTTATATPPGRRACSRRPTTTSTLPKTPVGLLTTPNTFCKSCTTA
ncbi:MAG: hypothetical protein D6796_15805 [Caldilineae bacterium]|nr:MAG: hypothetical protein D6796_15805 [Caldilineae bacterium]